MEFDCLCLDSFNVELKENMLLFIRFSFFESSTNYLSW